MADFKKIGILGAGQLAQMLALAGYNLNMRFALYNFDGEATADIGEIYSAQAGDSLTDFIDSLDLITYEFENLPVEALEKISQKLEMHPNAKSLEVAQHRGREKTFFTNLGLKVADFSWAQTPEDLAEFFAKKARSNKGSIIKSCEFGYDGKGQKALSASGNYDFNQLWQDLGGAQFHELLIEEKLEFERELSLISVRNKSGAIVFYPLVENQHQDGILRYSLAPAPNVSEKLQKTAENYARKILEKLAYVGTMALELFEIAGELLINEMAPRVHNSGHWSQDADCSSQFENHLRAVADLPLGATKPQLKTLMINLIGSIPDTQELLEFSRAKVHLYGKSPREGRKVGHINLSATNYADLLAEAQKLIEKLKLPELSAPVLDRD